MTKSRQISFNDIMVQAIINGTKSQTRRIVKDAKNGGFPEICHYGRIGDRLSVHDIFELEITNIRVERLNDISDEDAIREGVEGAVDGKYRPEEPRRMFKALWESIKGKGAWDNNPFVWVIEFKRVKGDA